MNKEVQKVINELEVEIKKAVEEREALRASNRIKQANIELLEAENAKLIAERNELIDDRDMLKMCADHYEDEIKRLLAEREAMMKQEPYGYVYSSSLDNHILHFSETKPIFSQEDGWEYEISTTPVFKHSKAVPECFVNLYKHALAMRVGVDWNNGTQAAHHRKELCDAVSECESFLSRQLPAQQIPEITLPLIKEALVEYFGHKCPDYDADCKCCQAWGQFEALQAKQTPKTIDNFNSIDVDGYDNIMQCKNCSYRYNEQADADERENSGRRQHNCADHNLVQQIPEGYALVPIEPTKEMLNAAREWSIKKNGIGVGNDQATGCYKAMLSASQPKGDV